MNSTGSMQHFTNLGHKGTTKKAQMQEKQTKLHFKVSFSWEILKNVVTLQSQTKSLQT